MCRALRVSFEEGKRGHKEEGLTELEESPKRDHSLLGYNGILGCQYTLRFELRRKGERTS